ncbi:MAG: FAD-binding oxidoreductase [Candidatus Omnitrophota bacterium]
MAPLTIQTTVTEIIPRTYNVKSFRFIRPEGLTYKAGQYLVVMVAVGEIDTMKALSISSSPTEEGHIEFTKKLTDSDFSKTLSVIKPGAPLYVRLPMGNFTFTGEYEKIAFLSGGIGITPIRSIIKYATDMQLSSSVVLLNSNTRVEDIAFKDELDAMQKSNKNLRIIHTLTDLDRDSPGWSGCRGYITKDMVRANIPDFEERKFYLCGPPEMVSALTAILTAELSVKKENIILENFQGY